MSKSKAKNTNNNYNINSVPDIVFRSFKSCRNICIFFNIFSALAIIWFGSRHPFVSDNLKDISDFSTNIIFVIGALGISIFSLPIDKNNKYLQDKKPKIMIRYIGSIFVYSSICAFGYALSFLDQNAYNIKLYCISGLILLPTFVTITIATIVSYFNIRK